MLTKFHHSDIPVLLKLFGKKEQAIIVYDPKKILFGEALLPTKVCETPKELTAFLSKASKPFFLVLLATYKKVSNYFSSGSTIISFAPSRMLEIQAYYSEKFYLTNNRDQSIRWAIPKNLVKPTFLALYNSSTIIASLYKELVKISYALGMKSLFASGKIFVYTDFEPETYHYLKTVAADNFSIFTGTVGEDRTAVIELNISNATTHFVKIPLSKESTALVTKEMAVLAENKLQKFKSFHSPMLVNQVQDNFEILTNIKPNKTDSAKKLQMSHFAVLKELYATTSKVQKLKDLAIIKKIEYFIAKLEKTAPLDTHIQPDQLLTLVKSHYQNLPLNQEIPVSFSHGDFTPWNMYLSKSNLFLYDWELAQDEAPLLYDMFHFVFQTAYLIDHANYTTIKLKIEETLLQPNIQALINQYNIDVKLHLRIYLLYIASYYLERFFRQKHLFKQAFWALNIWKSALKDLQLLSSTKDSNRNAFVNDFFEYLKPTDYAVLKFVGNKEFELHNDSDIDLLIRSEEKNELLSWIKTHFMVEKVSYYHKSYMSFAFVYFKDQSFLEIDLLHQFVRKTQVFMDAREVLQSTIQIENNIKVPQLHHQFEYIWLFYLLNQANIPVKYQDAFNLLDAHTRTSILSFINHKYKSSFTNLSELYQYQDHIYAYVKNINHKKLNNTGINRLPLAVKYMVDTLIERRHRVGQLITFSGVDGAGKSTVIAHFKKSLETKYRLKVKVLRQRPSILPILSTFIYGKQQAEKKATVTLPRTGSNKSAISSLFRFFYYFVDYILGQYYVYLKYNLRGYTVLYDRYYFDFMVDAKRTNITLPKWFLSLWYPFIFKPNINFFLYADPTTILKRKKELTENDIQTLTNSYIQIFGDLKKGKHEFKYVCVENKELGQTLHLIDKVYSLVKAS